MKPVNEMVGEKMVNIEKVNGRGREQQMGQTRKPNLDNDQQFKEKYGPWALVTGASAGIGAAFSEELAAKGLNVVLLARGEERLLQLASRLENQYGVDVRTASVDVSAENFMDAVHSVTDDLEVGLVVNNAGVAEKGPFLDNDLEGELRTLYVNNRAPITLAHAFGRRMRDRGRGGIIFIGSTIGFAPAPYFSNYAASKSHLLYLSDGLGYELREHGVDVLTVSPGPTKTDMLVRMIGDASMPGIPQMAPRDVAVIGLRALGRKASVVPGMRNSFMAFMISRLLPRRLSTTMLGKTNRTLIETS